MNRVDEVTAAILGPVVHVTKLRELLDQGKPKEAILYARAVPKDEMHEACGLPSFVELSKLYADDLIRAHSELYDVVTPT